MIVQKAEIAHKVEVGGPLLKARQVDDLGKVAMPVAPVEGRDRHQIPGARGITAPLVLRQIVEWGFR